MIGKDEIAGMIEDYDRLKLRVGMTASHSALDICDGAIEKDSQPLHIVRKVETRLTLNISKLSEPFLGKLEEEWSTKQSSWIHSTML